jgi:hypothetical protein
VSIFLAALVALRIASAVGDLDHDEGGDAFLGDEVVEDARGAEVGLA